MQFRTQPLTDIRNQELIPPPPQSLLFPKSVSHLGFFPPPNSMGLRLEIGCKEIVRGFERISLSHLFFCFTYFTAWCVLIDGVMGHIPCMEYLLEIKKKNLHGLKEVRRMETEAIRGHDLFLSSRTSNRKKKSKPKSRDYLGCY